MKSGAKEIVTGGYILLDTNTLWSDFYLKKQIFSDLKYHAAVYNMKILIPSIVRDEVFTNFEKQWDDAVFRFTKDFIHHAETLKLDIEKKKALEQLSSAWSDFLENDISELLDCSKLDMGELISRSIKGLRPFQASSDKGFKDTLIWMSVIEYLKKIGSGAELIVITNNKSDFTEDNKQLASNLILELDTMNVSGSYFQGIGHYLNDESKKDKGIVAIRSALTVSMPEQIQYHFDSYDYYRDSIDEWVYDHTDIYEQAISSINFGNPTIKFIDIRNLRTGKRSGDKKSIISGEAAVELEVNCNYAVDVDYDGTVAQEADVRFSGYIPFVVLMESEADEAYEMPELEEFKLTKVEIFNADDGSYTITHISS